MFCIASPHHFHSCQERRRPEYSFMDDFPELLLTSHPLFQFLRQRNCEKQKTWIRRVRLNGFDPDDIKLTVTEDNRLQIHARHEESREEDCDVYESTRILSIPENVDTKQLKSRLLDNGVLIFQAPYTTGDNEHTQESASKETKGEKEIQVESTFPENTTRETSEQIITKNDSIDGNEEVNEENIEKGEVFDTIQKTESLETKPVPDESKQLEIREENDVTQNAEDFHLNLHLPTFSPEDIKVIRKEKSLVVKAERKQETGGMKVLQHYSSEHSLPSDVDMDGLTCVKNSEGQLVISAPYRLNE